MREPRRAVAAVLLGLSAAVGTVDTFAIWGADTERRLLIVQLGLSLGALLLALCGEGHRLIPALSTRLRSSRLTVLPLAALAGWLAWASVGVVVADFARLHGALTLASMALTAVAAAAVMRALGWYGGALVAASAVGGHAVFAAIAMWTTDFDMSRGRLRLAALEPNQLARPVALAALLASVVAIESANRRSVTSARAGGQRAGGQRAGGQRAGGRRAGGQGASIGWAALALVCLGTLALTESRTATAALGASVAVWIIVNRRYRLATVLVLGCVAGLVLLSSLGLTGRVVDRLNRGESSTAEVLTLTGRTTLWPIVLDRAEEDFWTGVGVGNDRQAVVQAAVDGGLDWRPQHAHNIGLHLLLVSGVPGLALGALAMVLAALAALWRRDAVSVAVVVLLVIDGLSEAVLTSANLAWTLFACCVAAPLLSRNRVQHRPRTENENQDPVGGDQPRRSFDRARPVGAWLASISLAAAVVIVTFTPFDLPYRLRCGDLPLKADAIVDVEGVRLDGEAVELPGQTAELVRCAGLVDGGFTLEMTVSPDRLDQVGPARIFTLSEGTDWNDIDFHVGQEGTALSVRVRRHVQARSDNLVEGVFSETGRPHHVAVVVTRDGAQVYLDGRLHESLDLRVSFESWDEELPALLGNESTGDRPFVGDIGHLRLWRGVLDAERIEALSAE